MNDECDDVTNIEYKMYQDGIYNYSNGNFHKRYNEYN